MPGFSSTKVNVFVSNNPTRFLAPSDKFSKIIMFDLSIPTNTIIFYMDSYFGFLTYKHLFRVIYARSCTVNIYCTVTVKYVFVRNKIIQTSVECI